MGLPKLDDAVVRLRLDVAYDGTDFSGWASQPGLRTVQGVLEGALAMILRLPSVSLTVAGRTDAGVHARGQVCHVDLPLEVVDRSCDLARLTARLDRLLGDDVRVRRMQVAPAGFDARFSASWRRYAYRVCDSPPAADPLTRRHTLSWPRRLDEAAMNSGAAQLLGEHDFAAFCRRRAGATTVRALKRLELRRVDNVVTASVVADAFCHSMVRSLVGCLMSVGEGRQPVEWPLSVLRAGCRDSRVKVVPALGLTLEEVGYPAEGELARRASQTRRLREPASPGDG